MLERKSYFGGFTQVFQHGEQKDCNSAPEKQMVYLDYNSMYPQQLKYEKMPLSPGVLQNEAEHDWVPWNRQFEDVELYKVT